MAVIGAGGIGSHFCSLLDWAIQHEQVDFERASVHVYDFDTVDTSNLRHQDYTANLVGAPKVYVMNARYGYHSYCTKFGMRRNHYTETRSFVICADNPGVRLGVYEHCRDHNKPFIDLRCEGDMMAVLTDTCASNVLLDSLGMTDAERKDERGRSCQRAEDVRNNRVQLGHLAVAVAGLQVMLNRVRGEAFPDRMIRTVV
jgi:molybdopterin/thiamine biosynthesis adenylyltransferase